MRGLVFEVETLVINIFQSGFISVNQEFMSEIKTISEKCERYNLIILSNLLMELLDSIQNDSDSEKAEKMLKIVKAVDILKNKISYDELGGY